ncbi:MAG: DUF5666 domain-containing protein [Chloroflexota bacterium]|nr:DUF5666 domain-containing protein [Chloroflexota bacterium]
MSRALIILAGALILAFAVACGSADEGGGGGGGTGAPAAAQVADLSQFPTPTRSQAAPQPEPTQPVAAAAVQTQSEDSDSESETAAVEPMSQEELQQLRQRLQSGELSAEERQEAIQRLRAQFGGGQGGQGGFGGGGGTQAVGSIESINGSTLSVSTELATISATVGENANIRITSVLEPTELTEGAQIMVVSERVDGSTLARVITVVPEGQGGFGRRGAGGGQGGQAAVGGAQQGGQAGGGARPLFGSIESIADSGFTLETQQGPLPIAVNDETVIIQTLQGTVADLKAGMQVSVFGAADDEGTIEARTVAVIPAGLEDIPGLGGGGFAGRGRGGFGGGQGGGQGGGGN